MTWAELASWTWVVYEEQTGVVQSQLSFWNVPGLRKRAQIPQQELLLPMIFTARKEAAVQEKNHTKIGIFLQNWVYFNNSDYPNKYTAY